MGGGGGGSKKKKSPPPQAQPIDYGAIMAQASAAAQAQYRDQLAAQIEAYPKQEELKIGTIQKIADNLRTPYTQRATDQLIAAGRQADELQTVADFTDNLGYTAADDLQGTGAVADTNAAPWASHTVHRHQHAPLRQVGHRAAP